MITYAQTSDLTPTWVAAGDVPPNAAQLLTYATIAVAEACQRDPFTDVPTAAEAPVLTAATCAQVASWVALGVDPAKAGTDMPGPVKSSSILDATVARDTTAATQLTVEASKGLCDTARNILQTAGLLYVPVPLGDPAPYLPTYGLDSPRFGCGYGPYLAEGVYAEPGGWPFV